MKANDTLEVMKDEADEWERKHTHNQEIKRFTAHKYCAGGW